MKAKILIIEDELEMAAVLRDNLEYEGYEIETAHDGVEGIDKVFSFHPDLIVLDILMPNKDGTDVCLHLRSRGIDTPILFLTAKGSEVDRVLGLEIGGDDYLCKPFFMKEFLARVKALLRRRGNSTSKKLRIGISVVDLQRFSLIDNNGKEYSLSHYEVAILQLLLEHAPHPVSRNLILNTVWGIDVYPGDRTIDNYIVKLRKKLEENPRQPRYIITVHSVGYKLVL